MKELLKRWSELEPDYCEESVADSGCFYLGNNPPYKLVDPNCLDDLAVILGATITALDARGWEWELSSCRTDDGFVGDEPSNFYHAEVYREDSSEQDWVVMDEGQVQRTMEQVSEAQSEEAAAALLKAYLDALRIEQAEKKEEAIA